MNNKNSYEGWEDIKCGIKAICDRFPEIGRAHV